MVVRVDDVVQAGWREMMLRTLDACRMRYIARWRQWVITGYRETELDGGIRMPGADTGDAEE